MLTIDLIRYVCFSLNDKGTIPLTKLARVLYLIDWRSCLDSGSQSTAITWGVKKGILWAYGLKSEMENAKDVGCIENKNENNEIYKLISCSEKPNENILQNSVHWSSICFVLDMVKNLTHEDLYETVYSTYPIMIAQEHEDINLVKAAEEYTNIQSNAA